MHSPICMINGKSFAYCFIGTVVSLFAICYSFYVPWALMNLDMTGAMFKAKVPVLLWQGCFYDNACMVSPLVDMSISGNSTLTFDATTLSLLSNPLLVVCFLHFLGICINAAACSIHLLDMYKIRIMQSRLRYVYPSAVACNILSLLVFFPPLVYFMQGGFLLSGSLILICNALFGICNCIMYLSDFYVHHAYTLLP